MKIWKIGDSEFIDNKILVKDTRTNLKYHTYLNSFEALIGLIRKVKNNQIIIIDEENNYKDVII